MNQLFVYHPAHVCIIIYRDAYNAVLTLDSTTSIWSVTKLTQLPGGTQPQLSPDELLACEDIVRKDPRVQQLARDVGESNFCCQHSSLVQCL